MSNLNWVEEYHDVLDKFEEKIACESSIPQKIPRISLIRYIQVYNFNIERGLQLLKANVQYRSAHTSMFSSRDIDSEEIKRIMKVVQIADVPKLTKEQHQIVIFRLTDFDSNNFNLNAIFKYVTMFHDMFHLRAPKNEGDIFIFDARGLTLWHLMKVVASLNATRIFLSYKQDFTPIRLMQNHVVNCSPVFKRIFECLTPFLNNNLLQTFHFHSSDFKTLYEFIQEDFLPLEYGGTAGSLDEFSKQINKSLEELKDYIKDDRNFFTSK